MIVIFKSLFEVQKFKSQREIEAGLKRLYELYDEANLGEVLEEDQTYFDYYSRLGNNVMWYTDEKGQLDFEWVDNLDEWPDYLYSFITARKEV
jgi:hypothetical protein